MSRPAGGSILSTPRHELPESLEPSCRLSMEPFYRWWGRTSPKPHWIQGGGRILSHDWVRQRAQMAEP